MIVMLVFGAVSAGWAQTDSVSGKSSFSCFYIDDTFQCNLNEDENISKGRKECPSNDVLNPKDEGASEENAEGEVEVYDRPGVVNDDLYLENEVERDG